MTDSPGRIAERLAQDGQRSIDFFRGLTPAQWSVPIYASAPGVEESGWTPHQILAHFVSAEAANAQVVRDILAGGQGAPEDFDIDAFNLAEVIPVAKSSPQALLERFHQLRLATIELVNLMHPEDLERTGRHPFFGSVALEEILKLIYRHNQVHLRDIRRTLNL